MGRAIILGLPVLRLALAGGLGLALAAIMLLLALQPPGDSGAPPAAWRPLTALPPTFWVPFATGLGAWLVSAWVWALRPGSLGTRLFAASGAATFVFCFAALRSDIGLQLSPDLMLVSVVLNVVGASAFGLLMISLFAVYPRPLPHAGVLLALAWLVLGGWTAVAVVTGRFGQVQIITFIEMLGILLVAGAQVVASRGAAEPRAISIWLAAIVILGAGPFIAVVAIPNTFGFPSVIDPRLAFGSFLVIYAGVAIGLVRYRLFDLGSWAWTLLFYALAVLLLAAVDLVLISFLAVEPGPALALSLVLVGFLWLPLRDRLWGWMTRRQQRAPADAMTLAVAAGLQPTPALRGQAWRDLLRTVFEPLELVDLSGSGPAQATATADGLALQLPEIDGSGAIELRHARSGRGFFTPEDTRLARQLTGLLATLADSRHAYDLGVERERSRIQRDMHDNIGAQLLRALHSPAASRKDEMIRSTLVDLRAIINNASAPDEGIEALLGDLRAETSERLSAVGVTLDWQVEGLDEVAGLRAFDTLRQQALRSLIREACSNAIKHAAARTVTVQITITAKALVIQLADDGIGLNAASLPGDGHGLGLPGMAERCEGLGGSFRIGPAATGGTVIEALIPLGSDRAEESVS